MIRDDAGRQLVIERTNRLITAVTDPAGKRYTYTYDATGRLIGFTDAAGDTTGYNYNGDLIAAITKPDGSSSRYFYKELNGKQVLDYNLDEHGNPEHFAYYPDLGYTDYTNRAGITERNYFDADLQNTRIEYADDTALQKEYEAAGNLIRLTDQLGQVYEYTYDDRHNLLTSRDAAGSVECWTYNSLSRVTVHTDKAGNITNRLYDDRGSLLSVQYPDGAAVSYGYNAKGQPVSFTDQAGVETVYGYDAYGYLEAVKTGEYPPVHYTNDILGNVIRYTDQEGNVFTFEYNADNRVIRETDAYGNARTYTYSNRKDLTAITDRLGNT